MRTLLLLILSFPTFAANYFVSNGGNDGNIGTTISVPWRTIAKVNSFTLIAGDSVFFERGSTFVGCVIPNTNNIYYGAYGTGNKPVVTGLQTLTGWSLVSAGIYKVNSTSIKNNVNFLLIDGIPQVLARTPNAGSWYRYSSGTTSQTVSTDLTGTPNYTGAEMIRRNNHYRADRGRITSQATNTITYTDIQTIDPKGGSGGLGFTSGNAGYGFFLQRCGNCLDTLGEFYFDTTTNDLKIFTGAVNPTAYTIQVPVLDTLFNTTNKTGITVENFTITGANWYAVTNYQGSGLKVKSCDFANNTVGVVVYNSASPTIDNNTFNNSFCMAITVANNLQNNFTITNNVVTNTGKILGQGLFDYDYQLKGIVAASDSDQVSNTGLIRYNRVSNTGHAGIQFQGSNVTVKNNFVYQPLETLDDNGAIYTFMDQIAVSGRLFSNRVVDSNIIVNVLGNSAGTPSSSVDVAGLYFDDHSRGISATGNTIYNVAGNGIQCNNPVNVTIRGNTVHNANYLMNVNQKAFSRISNFSIKKNIFYPLNNTQYQFQYTDSKVDNSTPNTIVQSMSAFADMDSNYTYQAKTNGYNYYYSQLGNGIFTFPSDINLATWQSTYGHDVHGVPPPVAVTGILFSYNATNAPVTYNFSGQRNIDVLGNNYDNSIVIPAWGNVLLLRNGIPPTPTGNKWITNFIFKNSN